MEKTKNLKNQYPRRENQREAKKSGDLTPGTVKTGSALCVSDLCKPSRSSRCNDLTGQRFGKLVVEAKTDKRIDSGSVVWRCRCDCGNTAEVSARRLIRGKVRSCGCLSSPPPKDYVGKTFGRLTVLEYAGTAKELGHAGSMNYWKCRCSCGRKTIVGQTELQNGESRSCGCLQKELARAALKLVEGTSVTILETAGNCPRKNNTSGYTGVYREKSGHWVAYISFKKKRYWLGRYRELEDAVKARKSAEAIHKDFLEWYYREHPNVLPQTKQTEETVKGAIDILNKHME